MSRPEIGPEIEVAEEQALYFRARRGHLAGPGASSPNAAAAAILGAQSQQLAPGLLAISQRTAGRPTADELRGLLFEDRTLVRTWGQRDTVHIYDPRDWPDVVAAKGEWAPGGRGGPMPSEDLVDRALERLRQADRPLARSDLFDLLPASYVRAIGERAKLAGLSAERLAAARLLWRLNHRGDACIADSVGAEAAYAAREAWFPGLVFPDPPADALAAAVDLARRYLRANAPASANDLAHFFNARVTNARRWLEELESSGELIGVRCGDRKGLVALAEDAGALQRRPPKGSSGWPLRLLPMWDTLLMCHADKSWTVASEAERKAVWRKAAMVSAVVLARGRVVATWTSRTRRRRLEIAVVPLSGWSAHLAPGVRREAKVVASHLGLADSTVEVG